MVAPTPENVKSWFNTVWPALCTASPVTVMIVLALWTASIYWFTTEVQRIHDVNQALWERLLTTQKDQVDLAWRCYQGQERPPYTEP